MTDPVTAPRVSMELRRNALHSMTPRISVIGVSAHGWFGTHLSLASWACERERMQRNCLLVSVQLEGDLVS